MTSYFTRVVPNKLGWSMYALYDFLFVELIDSQRNNVYYYFVVSSD